MLHSQLNGSFSPQQWAAVCFVNVSWGNEKGSEIYNLFAVIKSHCEIVKPTWPATIYARHMRRISHCTWHKGRKTGVGSKAFIHVNSYRIKENKQKHRSRCPCCHFVPSSRQDLDYRLAFYYDVWFKMDAKSHSHNNTQWAVTSRNLF